MAGHDPHDATSSREAVPDYVAELERPIKGLRLGVPKEFFAEGLDPGVKQVVEEAIAKLESLGAEVQEVSLPSMAYALAAYYVICPSEVSANLARYDSVRYGAAAEAKTLYERYAKTRGAYLGAEAKRRIMLGTYVLSAGYYDAYYRTAQAVRMRIKQEFAEVFAKVDALATPTAPSVAFPLGSKADDPLALYLADVYTVPANIAGLPAMSVPCGMSSNMPVGLQLIAAPFAESTMLRLAHAYEQACSWADMHPKF
jgi:aspartyl-tRNA(Asn)/glutamyl-tRNA(Gln) amidotransferase subunit A